MNWEEIIKFSSAVLLSTFSLSMAFVWLSKTLFKFWFDKELENHKEKLSRDLETHKSELQRNANEYQARISSELQRLNNEHSVKFLKLHEKRAEIIESLYKYILEARALVDIYPDQLFERDEELKRSHMHKYCTAIWNMHGYIKDKRLYFSKDLLELIDDYINFTFSEPVERSIEVKKFEGRELSQLESTMIHGEYKKSVEKLNNIQGKIEEEFKKLLGVG